MTEEEKAVERLRCVADGKPLLRVYEGDTAPESIRDDLRTLLAAYERRGEALESAQDAYLSDAGDRAMYHIIEAALNQETHHA